MLSIGDKVVMNDRYYVPEKYKEKEFSVIAGPEEVGGTMCVWLDGYEGCYAEDGLAKVGMEARNYRCCMCPQIDENSHICPVGPGKTEETTCDFVVVWMDSRGWKYKVMGDLTGTFKGHYQNNKQNGDIGWKSMKQMKRKETFDQAQEDLNQYAKKKRWHKLNV